MKQIQILPSRPQNNIKHRIKNQKNLKILSEKKKPESDHFIASTWKSFTRHTSLHAVKYLTEAAMTLLEKVLWGIAILVALVGMVYCCLMLSNRFKNSKTSTVFESTSYKVMEIPFPAVTLCNNNRLDYNKTNAALSKFLPTRTKSETEIFVKFVHILQNQEFGSFDEFAGLKDYNVTFMDKLNITEIYDFMMHDCEVFFVSCWWREVPRKCCDLFSKQRSEYGICYSFNSFTSIGTKFVNVRTYQSNYGLNKI